MLEVNKACLVLQGLGIIFTTTFF